MIEGSVKSSGSAAIAAITGSGFDPEFPHGTTFSCVEIFFGKVEVFTDSGHFPYQQGREIPYLKTSLSTATGSGTWDHVVPLVRFNRRTTVHMVNLRKTEDQRKHFLAQGCPAADVARIEICENVPAPWLPGQGVFKVIQEDYTGLYKELAGYSEEYPTGELSKNKDQRLAAFLKGQKLVSDHAFFNGDAWKVWPYQAKSEADVRVYTNGLQYFRLVPTMEDFANKTSAWQEFCKANPTLWTQLFNAGAEWEEAHNASFVAKYGRF